MRHRTKQKASRIEIVTFKGLENKYSETNRKLNQLNRIARLHKQFFFLEKIVKVKKEKLRKANEFETHTRTHTHNKEK